MPKNLIVSEWQVQALLHMYFDEILINGLVTSCTQLCPYGFCTCMLLRLYLSELYVINKCVVCPAYFHHGDEQMYKIVVVTRAPARRRIVLMLVLPTTRPLYLHLYFPR